MDPTGSQALPAPLVLTGSRIQCSARPPHILHRDFETRAVEKKGSSDTPSRPQSSFIQHATALASAALPGGAKLRQRRHANAFSLPKNVQLGNTLTPFTVDGPIISIGPSTDAVLDRFKMGDELIPKLRELMSTVRSSRWEAVLRSPKWDLTFEQAVLLTTALNTDLQGRKNAITVCT